MQAKTTTKKSERTRTTTHSGTRCSAKRYDRSASKNWDARQVRRRKKRRRRRRIETVDEKVGV